MIFTVTIESFKNVHAQWIDLSRKLTLTWTLTCPLSKKIENEKKKKKQKRCDVCNRTVFEVICQERGQVLHHGFQTPRDRWKHEAIGRLLSFVSRCLERVMKYEVQFFTSSLKWYNKNANASVWSQIKNMFHRRWIPGDVLSRVSFKYQDSSTWSKWLSFIGFWLRNDWWVWEFLFSTGVFWQLERSWCGQKSYQQSISLYCGTNSCNKLERSYVHAQWAVWLWGTQLSSWEETKTTTCKTER